MGARRLLALPLAALATAGCDWRQFDTIQAHTPVLAVGAPSEFATSDFGQVILPLSTLPAGQTGGRFVVSGASADAITIIDVDAKGNATGQNVTSPDFEDGQPITALAEVPGTNRVLLGAPGGRGSVYVMTAGATPDVAVLDAETGADRFGLGVAAGQLAGTDAPDFVVASATDLTVYLDGDAQVPVPATAAEDTCPLALTGALAPRDALRRAVLVAPLTADPAASQIIVGTPTGEGQGAVDVFTVDPTTGVASCAFAYRNPDARFGHALATGDFDHDGHPDLLVGSPPHHAFLILGPLTPTSAVLPVTLAAGAGELGATVAAANLDGKPGDEALIGNPDATVDGVVDAGEVRVVTGAALDKELSALRRHNPGTNDAFGIDVDVLSFCAAGCAKPGRNLALIGASSRALVYFQLLPADTDPRTP